MSVSAKEALDRLRAGNERFVAAVHSTDSLLHTRKTELTLDQQPIAIILGCSDARVPAEMVFDQGLGDLFVIRVAGNIVAPSQVGSVEFAAERFGVQLVVVLGHTQCGAILATIEEIRHGSSHSRNLRSIVDRIRPTVQDLINGGSTRTDDQLVRAAVRANVRASTNHLRHGSASLEELILNNRLSVVGAEYSLATGVVDFFDNPD
jgi:carbonic anhydrase